MNQIVFSDWNWQTTFKNTDLDILVEMEIASFDVPLRFIQSYVDHFTVSNFQPSGIGEPVRWTPGDPVRWLPRNHGSQEKTLPHPCPSTLRQRILVFKQNWIEHAESQVQEILGLTTWFHSQHFPATCGHPSWAQLQVLTRISNVGRISVQITMSAESDKQLHESSVFQPNPSFHACW